MVEPVTPPVAGSPEDAVGLGQEAGSEFEGVWIVQIDVDQAVRRLAEDDANVDVVIIEVSINAFGVDLQVRPVSVHRPLAHESNWDRAVASSDVIRHHCCRVRFGHNGFLSMTNSN